MKTINVVLFLLLVVYFGPAFADRGVLIEIWKAGWTLLILLGVILVPGTFLVASYTRKPTWAPLSPRRLAAAYNGVAALLSGWHAVAMNVGEAHPVALAITEQAGSLVIALVAALNTWKLTVQEAERAPVTRLTWPTVVGVVGIIFGVAGILGALMFFYLPSSLQRSREWLEQIDTASIFPSEAERTAAHDRLSVPPWFTQYCFVIGAVGTIASILYIWGSLRLLQLRKHGRTLFMVGASTYTLVGASIATAGLVSSSPAIRENLFIALGSVVTNGLLMFVVGTRKHWLRAVEQLDRGA